MNSGARHLDFKFVPEAQFHLKPVPNEALLVQYVPPFFRAPDAES